MSQKSQNLVNVIVRVRPLNEREQRESAKSCLLLNPDEPSTLIIDSKPEKKVFSYDSVLGENCSQEDIYKLAGKPFMLASLEGKIT